MKTAQKEPTRVETTTVSPPPPTDDGLVVSDCSDRVLHAAPPPVVRSLRYSISRLQLRESEGLPRRLGVTSAMSGEGVTFISWSLATVLAHDTAASVCLVDLNWWAAGGSAAPGAAQVLTEGAALDEVLVRTNQQRLTYLPAGLVTPSDRPLLAQSLELQAMLADLGHRFDHVIVDLPPLLASSEALTLAGQTDACVVVALHGRTSVGDVRSALEPLAGIRILGLVLNRATSPVPAALLRRLPRS